MLRRFWCWLTHDKRCVIGPFDAYYRCDKCGNKFFL